MVQLPAPIKKFEVLALVAAVVEVAQQRRGEHVIDLKTRELQVAQKPDIKKIKLVNTSLECSFCYQFNPKNAIRNNNFGGLNTRPLIDILGYLGFRRRAGRPFASSETDALL